MKKNILLKLFYALFVLVGVLFLVDASSITDRFFPHTMSIGERIYILEKVDTAIAEEKGLGGRESLCTTCGMLFEFKKPGRYAFWMKDMRFPLDIVWFLGDRVVFIAHDVQSDFSGIFEPDIAADRVVEVNAGVARNLLVGDKIFFSHKFSLKQ